MSSAQGIDISAYQPVYSAGALAKYSFAFFRATVGSGFTDSNFAANWANAKSAGIHRGAYHELEGTASASASAQADHFISTVRARGVEYGDMFAIVASDYSGVTGAEVLSVLNACKDAFPHCPVFVYSDLSFLGHLSDCTDFGLWIAAYQDTAPDVSPWPKWYFWQWSDNPIDQDAYNGTAEELSAWLESLVPKPAPTPAPTPPPADWTYGPPTDLKVVAAGYTSVKLSWGPPADAPLPVSAYTVYMYEGTDPSAKTEVYTRNEANGNDVQLGSLKEGTEYTVHVVAALDSNGANRVRPMTYASAAFRTGVKG